MNHDELQGACRTGGVRAALAAMVIGGLAVAAMPVAAAAAADEAAACLGLIKATEKAQNIPEGVLKTIGFRESGRVTVDGRQVPWPWTVNAQGQGRFFETKADAVAFVQLLQQQGVSVIDVGCMQVNLHYHPGAFESLDAAFDPATNVAYAAEFLNALKSETGDWGIASQYYHSRNGGVGPAYAGRVTLNAFGKVISNLGPIKPLTKDERAALAADVPDALAAADELVGRLRTLRQPAAATDASIVAAVPLADDAPEAIAQAMTQAAEAQPTTRIAATTTDRRGTND
jgi:hypothetical protein